MRAALEAAGIALPRPSRHIEERLFAFAHCQRKHRFTTIETAIDHVRRVGYGRSGIYRCSICAQLHVSHITCGTDTVACVIP